jgi:hypothetical protein
MRRRRRAAWGPLGGRSGLSILDVILHLDSCKVKRNYEGTRGQVGNLWSEVSSGAKRAKINREVLNQPVLAGSVACVNELLTHYTSLNFRGK